MGWWVVLGEIISQVFLATVPIYIELLLLYVVNQLVEAHVNGFASILPEDAIDDAVCGVVASAQLGGCLWVSKFC